jgi:hypothetical protein
MGDVQWIPGNSFSNSLRLKYWNAMKTKEITDKIEPITEENM